MNSSIDSGRWLAAASVLSLLAVGAALVTQHVFDMQPCPWCVLQRLIFIAIAIVAALGAIGRIRVLQWTSAALVLVLAATGIAAALWQHFVASASASCNRTLADRIVSELGLDGLAPQVFAATASCADAKVNLYGVPYELWSVALFALIGLAVALKVLPRSR